MVEQQEEYEATSIWEVKTSERFQVARAGEPADRDDPIDAEASQQLAAEDKQVAATSTDRGKGTLLTAASKHSAVKSKAAKPWTVLQCIAENIESTQNSAKKMQANRVCSVGTLG